VTDDRVRWPLAHRGDDLARIATLTEGAVAAAEVTGLSQVALRVDAADVDALGFPVPLRPNTAATTDGHEVLWLGPDAWLVVTADPVEELLATIDAALAAVPHAAVDLSANHLIVDLSGAARHELLGTRCPLDLHPRSWQEGMCAQTLIGRAQGLLQHRGDATRLFVRPSFGGYLVDLLLDAATAVVLSDRRA
jgi:sarcosine oxidase subunit gamma